MARKQQITLRVPTSVLQQIELFGEGETRTDKTLDIINKYIEYQLNHKQNAQIESILERLAALESSVIQMNVSSNAQPEKKTKKKAKVSRSDPHPLLETICEIYSQQKEQGKSNPEIAEYLNEQGYKTRDDNEWNANSLQKFTSRNC